MTRVGAVLAVLVTLAGTASAHPAPFSYIDLTLADGELRMTVVAHVYDLAHDLGIAPSESLLEPRAASQLGPAIATLLQPRIAIDVNGRRIACSPTGRTEVVAARQS